MQATRTICLYLLGVLVSCSAVLAADQRPEWLGSKAGISDALLPPWTPVEVSGDAGKVTVWGRTIGFEVLPLPASLVARDAELLAGPIVLRGRVDGKPVAWTPGTRKVTQAKPGIVRLATSAKSAGMGCRGTVGIEYDGMIRCNVKLLPEGKINVQRLVLEVPIRAAHAKYLHYWPGRWGSCFNSAALPEDGYRGPFRPFVWLGDEWRGLAWFAESDESFFNEKADRVIEIERRADTVILRVNLITQPQVIEGPLEYTFGFQATPVKPPRPDVWDYRICHSGSYSIGDKQLDELAAAGIRTMCFHEQWTDIQAYTSTTHGPKLRKLVKACHDRNIQLLLYHGYEMSTIAPEWDKYHEKCLVRPRRGGYKRKYQPQPDQTAYIVCYRSVWQDFVAHGINRLMDEYGIDGVYLDGTSEPWGCANVEHGCGYKRPDGKIGKTYPIFSTRRMMKRIYTIVKAHNSKGQVNVHQSTCMTIPTLSFATSYWDGEQLQSVKRRPFAQEVLPLDAFRTEFMGHNWGVPAELLWYGSGPFKRSEAESVALLHDVLVRPSGTSAINRTARLWKVMDAFGRAEAAWLPYWENQKYVGANSPGVKASIYNRPGKGFVAVVCNTGAKNCRAEVTFNLKTLSQPAELKARDVFTDKTIPITAGRVNVPLESLDSLTIWAEP